MTDWNLLAVVVAVALILLWKLEFVSKLLDLAAFPAAVPAVLGDVMNEERLGKARDYLRVNTRFDVVRSALSLAALLGFWSAGGFGWLDGWARSIASGPVAVGLVFLAVLFLAQSLLGLPFAAYETFVIEGRFGFNRTRVATFVIDRIKGLLLAGLIGLPLAAALLWIFGTVAHAWLWAWLVVTTVQLLLTWLAPTFILPWFNKFTPMPEGLLKQEIEALGKRCGFPLDGVFVMDGSKRSSKANAFFTGIGRRKKIALFDTLIETCSTPELLGVLAHEIGHFRCGHIRQRLAAGVVQTAAIFFLLGLATDPQGGFARQLFDAFGLRDISPHAGFVIFGILCEPLSLALGVVFHAWSRRHEFEADAYAAKATGDAAPLAEALKKMTADHLSHPTPARLGVWLHHSHPPLIERLRALSTAGHGG